MKARRALLLLAGFMLPVQMSQAEGFPDFPFVVVTGEATIEVPPDRAQISFTITEFDVLSANAVATAMARTNAILKVLETHGISSFSAVFGRPRDRVMLSGARLQTFKFLVPQSVSISKKVDVVFRIENR